MTEQTTRLADDQALDMADLDHVVAATGLTKVGAGTLSFASANTSAGATQLPSGIIAI
jgi:autotransporter-associated beta strand protein